MCAGLHCSGFMSTSSFPQVLLKPYADRRSTTSRSSLQISVNYSEEYFLITIQPPRTRVHQHALMPALPVRLLSAASMARTATTNTHPSYESYALVVYIKYVTTKYVASERTDSYCGEYVSCTLRALGTRDWGLGESTRARMDSQIDFSNYHGEPDRYLRSLFRPLRRVW